MKRLRPSSTADLRFVAEELLGFGDVGVGDQGFAGGGGGVDDVGFAAQELFEDLDEPEVFDRAAAAQVDDFVGEGFVEARR